MPDQRLDALAGAGRDREDVRVGRQFRRLRQRRDRLGARQPVDLVQGHRHGPAPGLRASARSGARLRCGLGRVASSRAREQRRDEGITTADALLAVQDQQRRVRAFELAPEGRPCAR